MPSGVRASLWTLKPRDERQAAGLDHLADQRAEQATGGQHVVGLAAEELAEVGAAHDPGDPRRRRLVGQSPQVDQGVEGRVAAADHHDAASGVAVAVPSEHVGNAVDDPVGDIPLADRGHPVRRPAGSGWSRSRRRR